MFLRVVCLTVTFFRSADLADMRSTECNSSFEKYLLV